jgi:transcription elongation GreA/GreB family factor
MKYSLNEKIALIKLLILGMEEECQIISAALANAVDGATNPESKPEGKYDTRALESSYLAGAQQERLRELRASIDFVKSQQIHSLDSNTAIIAPALVSLQNESGEARDILLVAAGGGVTLPSEQFKIQVVTPNSPIGAAVNGKRTGDFVSWGQSAVEWEVVFCI